MAAVATGAGVGVSRRALAHEAFGPLEADPDGVLDLPAGFSYVKLQVAGATMSDGQVLGGSPDGMACFEDDDGNYVLLRNHELALGSNPLPGVAFDTNAVGGVSRVVIDPESLEVLSSNLVLTGTIRNCAGGPSPWGWLSCEEAEDPGHGWVFLCSTAAEEAELPQRIKSFGRFKHEAVAVDPKTAIVYLTEDVSDSALYRHVPDDEKEPFVGRLQALAIVGEDAFDTKSGISVGDSFDIRWVAVDDPEAAIVATRVQAHVNGAAVFVRGEGIWFDDGSVFFTATEGGPTSRGQVWRLDLDGDGDGGELTLLAQAEGDGELRSPDNLTVSPWGDLVVCEDNDGPNHLRGITPDGEIFDIARNAVEEGRSEFCGVCFSPDGKVLFVNLQEPGYTLAVTGPFPDPRGCGC
jgi:secreted PhoX family phosphatase